METRLELAADKPDSVTFQELQSHTHIYTQTHYCTGRSYSNCVHLVNLVTTAKWRTWAADKYQLKAERNQNTWIASNVNISNIKSLHWRVVPLDFVTIKGQQKELDEWRWCTGEECLWLPHDNLQVWVNNVVKKHVVLEEPQSRENLTSTKIQIKISFPCLDIDF